MTAAFRRWWLRVRLKRACNTIRREAARLGIDLSEFTDDELVERAGAAGKAMAYAGTVSMEQAAEAFRQLRRAAGAVDRARKAREQIAPEPEEESR